MVNIYNTRLGSSGLIVLCIKTPIRSGSLTAEWNTFQVKRTGPRQVRRLVLDWWPSFSGQADQTDPQFLLRIY